MDFIIRSSILLLISSIFILSLGFFMWLKKRRDMLYILFFIFCSVISFALFATFKLSINTSGQAILLWSRYAFSSIIFIPIILYHISLHYNNTIKKQKLFLLVGYILSFIFLALSQSNNIISGIVNYNNGITPTTSTIYNIFIIHYIVFSIAFFYNIYQKIKSLKGKNNKQAIIVFYFLILSFFIGLIGMIAPYYQISAHLISLFSGILFVLLLIYLLIKNNSINTKTIFLEISITLLNTLLILDLFTTQLFISMNAILLYRVVLVIGYMAFSLYLIKIIHIETHHRKEIEGLIKSLKKSNTTLTKTNIQLQELDRQKNEFLAISTHHLRTPLSIIKGYISLLKEGDYGKIPKKATTVLNNINQANTTLITLVDDFLNVTLLEQEKIQFFFKSYNMNTLTQEALNHLENKRKEKGLKIIWESNPDLENIMIDGEKIKHAMSNLIDNAIKYTEKGKIIITVKKRKKGIQFIVKDSGIGFEKDDEANLFQKFYRGKNVARNYVTGTGLGLYVSKRFVERHKGEIWAKSSGLKKGSIFGFWLPFKR